MPKPRSGGWLRLLLPLIGQAIYEIKLTLLFSALVTSVVFYNLQQVPLLFLTGLVTLDSLLIAVIGLVGSVVLRAIGIEELRVKLGASAEDKGIIGIASQMGLAGLYTVPILLAIIAVLPYFIAAVISLVGMLMPSAIALYFGAIGFWLTLASFFGLLSLTWKAITRIWDAQVPNLKKLFERLSKYGWFRQRR